MDLSQCKRTSPRTLCPRSHNVSVLAAPRAYIKVPLLSDSILGHSGTRSTSSTLLPCQCRYRRPWTRSSSSPLLSSPLPRAQIRLRQNMTKRSSTKTLLAMSVGMPDVWSPDGAEFAQYGTRYFSWASSCPCGAFRVTSHLGCVAACDRPQLLLPTSAPPLHSFDSLHGLRFAAACILRVSCVTASSHLVSPTRLLLTSPHSTSLLCDILFGFPSAYIRFMVFCVSSLLLEFEFIQPVSAPLMCNTLL